ncbi:NifB/NifX family molybdenum-iron cluster-binding protein [Anoxybacter fermentans]|uniref:NifB/NifX family molybdenum-iron cluster-binding protein n=1 Tax=Anoxybacter fermentans TaxID=1323375 RepID=UPI000F8D8B1A|nr:NifB/NifX family molybdenum-iron cluster-binding protein [Anoxybacter fermentans]
MCYFIIFDLDTMDYQVIENEASDAALGAGVQSASIVFDEGVEVVLTGRVGPKALRGLKAGNVKICYNVSGKISEAIEKFKKGELEEFTEGEDEM